MIRYLPYLIAAALVVQPRPALSKPFNPDESLTSRVAMRFKTTFQRAGMSGVSEDVLKCYDQNIDNDDKTKECVVYDVAALMWDRQLTQLFVARGLHPAPLPLYTNEAFDARSREYGFPAFKSDPSGKRKVGAAAKRVIEKAFPN